MPIFGRPGHVSHVGHLLLTERLPSHPPSETLAVASRLKQEALQYCRLHTLPCKAITSTCVACIHTRTVGPGDVRRACSPVVRIQQPQHWPVTLRHFPPDLSLLLGIHRKAILPHREPLVPGGKNKIPTSLLLLLLSDHRLLSSLPANKSRRGADHWPTLRPQHPRTADSAL